MLRTIRIALAAVVFTLLTLLFLDFTGVLPAHFSWLAHLQLLPALLAGNAIIVVVLLLITLLGGRLYCSILCPLGVMQDILSATQRKKNRFHFSRQRRWLRYGVLGVFIILLVLGINAAVALLEPYSAYGRIATNILKPIYLWGNNLLAALATRADSYAFYTVDVWRESAVTLAVALATVVILAVLARHGGRTYCNTICPVGTLLGLIARGAVVKIRLREDKCIACGQCERNCKAACIDAAHHTIDHSRCVVCGNCIAHCHTHALTYALPQRKKKKEEPPAAETVDSRRRAMLLATTLATTTALLAQEQKIADGSLAIIEDKVAPARQTPLQPAGARSLRIFHQHCTACQLCVAACPEGVLRPTTALSTFMQPTMSYEHGYCRVECNTCSTVCPTGAIQPITLEEKAATQIGHAVYIRQNCVVERDHVQCWACASHCPTGAITLVTPLALVEDDKLLLPAIDTQKCIGCGACEHLCPARPLSAIYVEGHEVHKEI